MDELLQDNNKKLLVAIRLEVQNMKIIRKKILVKIRMISKSIIPFIFWKHIENFNEKHNTSYNTNWLKNALSE